MEEVRPRIWYGTNYVLAVMTKYLHVWKTSILASVNIPLNSAEVIFYVCQNS